jgi:transcriptional regulator with XRE-family HTH domain
VKELRESKGLTQQQVADLLGVNVGHVSKMENGKRKLGPQRAIALSEIYGAFIGTIQSRAFDGMVKRRGEEGTIDKADWTSGKAAEFELDGQIELGWGED